MFCPKSPIWNSYRGPITARDFSLLSFFMHFLQLLPVRPNTKQGNFVSVGKNKMFSNKSKLTVSMLKKISSSTLFIIIIIFVWCLIQIIIKLTIILCL